MKPETLDWFRRRYGPPTPVQAAGWPVIERGENALLVAPTGSGKTLAAFLEALDRLQPGPTRVLYVSPLKALVHDVTHNLLEPLAELGSSLRVAMRTGDTSATERRRFARNPAEILVTTPESLYLLLNAGGGLDAVETVIVDEAHALMGNKRGAHLALSLERLAERCGRDPQRIGLSATVRPLDEAARWLGGGRPVTVVDPGGSRELDLRVRVLSKDMDFVIPTARVASEDPRSYWSVLLPELVAQIRAHRSTIIFVNNRGLCERLASRLDEVAGEPIALAHHGSVSRERRREVESRLKAGSIRAVVATGSLELGIDMGAVDLVIQVGSPEGVARGLQRVGRAGHGVGQRSRGQLYPRHRAEILECAAVVQGMEARAIEAVRVPRCPLDVLAQHTLAAVARQPRPVADLVEIFRRAAPFSMLDRAIMQPVVDMLAGRGPTEDFNATRPRLVWDAETDTLSARPGTRALISSNAGTIPDRGSFVVQLGEGGPRVGELDEEMVFESRRGNVIRLGASAWRIERIGRDRVVVSPAGGEQGRLPFWRGEGPGRPTSLGRAMGGLARALMAGERPSLPVDEDAWANLSAFLEEQRRFTGEIPDDRTIVVERRRDEMGQWHLSVLTNLGRAFNAAWAMAVDDGRGQLSWGEEGLLFTFPEGEDPPPLSALLPDPDTLVDRILPRLEASALYAARFRENAARALVLPKIRGGRRAPLWAQRQRALGLQAATGDWPDFPVRLESLRECLTEALDVEGLAELLRAVERREIRVVEAEVQLASPLARELVRDRTAELMYLGDRAPTRQGGAVDLDLLRALLGDGAAVDLLEPEACAEVEAELRGSPPADAEAALDRLRRLGARPAAELAPWRAALGHRVLEHAGQVIAAEDAPRYAAVFGWPVPVDRELPRPLEDLVLRAARVSAPFAPEGLGLAPALVQPVVEALIARGRLVREGGRLWDPEVLRRVRRRARQRLRAAMEPVDGAALQRALLAWQGVGGRARGPERLEEVADQLEGLALPFEELERALGERMQYDAALLDNACSSGERVWVGRPGERVMLVARERLGAFHHPDGELPPALHPLRERGALFLGELGLGVQEALWAAVWAGQVTNDTLGPLRGRTYGVGPRRVPAGGRWSALRAAEASPTEVLAARLRALLAREGVVAADVVEGGFGGAYRALREMEDRGLVLRGLFVEGLPAPQFALPAFAELLRRAPGGAVALSVADPAVAWGRRLGWPDGQARRAGVVALVDGVPVLHAHNRRLTCFSEEGLAGAVAALRRARSLGGSLELEVEGELAQRLVGLGFTREGTRVRLSRL